MRVLRPASEDDMTPVFLAAGATPERYGPQIRGILARLRQPRGIVEQPDTRDEPANAAGGRCWPPTAATRRATRPPACPPTSCTSAPGCGPEGRHPCRWRLGAAAP